jgi:roadblock/LC7 domain-containing protein
MARIDELLKIDGAVAAGEFAPDGTLVDFKSNMNMSRDLAATTAQFCATVSMLFNTLAGAHSQLSGMRWLPQQGWAYSGGDMTVAGGRHGIFIKTEKADFNKLFEVLVGQKAVRA